MKAAVMNARTGVLRYADIPAPVVTRPDELLLTVKAVAIKNVDRSRASGAHYSTGDRIADTDTIIGSDGVGLLPDGRRVYAVNPGGKQPLHR